MLCLGSSSIMVRAWGPWSSPSSSSWCPCQPGTPRLLQPSAGSRWAGRGSTSPSSSAGQQWGQGWGWAGRAAGLGGQGEPGSTRVWAGGRRPAGRGEGLRLLQGQVLGKQGLGVVAQGQKPALSPCGALPAPQPRATRPHPRARFEPLGLFQIKAGIALALWASFELNLGTFVPFGVVSA